MNFLIGLVAAGAITVCGNLAHAQVYSTTTPTLQGLASVHAWTVPGVVSSGTVGSYFACTNATAAAVVVGVQIFGAGGGPALNDASSTSVSIPAGGTALLGTGPAAALSLDSNLAPGFLTKGSARILTTTTSTGSRYILCQAFLSSTFGDPPTSMATLAVIKGRVQKGQ